MRFRYAAALAIVLVGACWLGLGALTLHYAEDGLSETDFWFIGGIFFNDFLVTLICIEFMGLRW